MTTTPQNVPVLDTVPACLAVIEDPAHAEEHASAVAQDSDPLDDPALHRLASLTRNELKALFK
ncbi:MAG: hypothetical protein ABIJ09_26785 [Pseudomonadota bacterium]